MWLPGGERPLGRTRRRGEGNIEADVEEIGEEVVAT